jgi:hypothetical protein
MLMITINYVYGFRFLFILILFFSGDVEDEKDDFYGEIVYCYKCAIQLEIKNREVKLC